MAYPSFIGPIFVSLINVKSKTLQIVLFAWSDFKDKHDLGIALLKNINKIINLSFSRVTLLITLAEFKKVYDGLVVFMGK